DRYFDDPAVDALNGVLFALASYNAGPSRIAGLRERAASQSLNPNVWFENVELVAAQAIGQETANYVRNVYKYYVAYKLTEDHSNSFLSLLSSVHLGQVVRTSGEPDIQRRQQEHAHREVRQEPADDHNRERTL